MSNEWSRCRQVFDEGVAALDLPVSEDARGVLIRYLQEMQKWNDAYNLTSVADPGEMVTKHLLDSLAVLPHLRGKAVIDVGSGAGLPGIPLAVADSDRHFTLLDSNGKKAAFLRHAVRTLSLKNVSVVQLRAEDFAAGEGHERFTTVLSRAFASLTEMIEMAGPLCAADGWLLAMKAKLAKDEIDPVRSGAAGFKLERIEPLDIPGLGAERHLVIFSRAHG
jgi:16S rRNA (guanine527-N7)-methyltransferase